MLRNIIFDYGLVLCRPPTYQAIDRMAGVFGVDHPTFWALYERNRGLYDQGELTPEYYWSRFAQDAGSRRSGARIARRTRACDYPVGTATWYDSRGSPLRRISRCDRRDSG